MTIHEAGDDINDSSNDLCRRFEKMDIFVVADLLFAIEINFQCNNALNLKTIISDSGGNFLTAEISRSES